MYFLDASRNLKEVIHAMPEPPTSLRRFSRKIVPAGLALAGPQPEAKFTHQGKMLQLTNQCLPQNPAS